MSETPSGPDLALGVMAGDLPEGGKLVGHVGGEPVLLLRTGGGIFAVGALCTHYHGALADGLVVDGGVRCPLHHACFDLRSGEAVRAPALDPIACWNVVERDGRIFVGEKRAAAARAAPIKPPARIVIVGGGAAGFAAAEGLRRAGYAGSLTMLSQEDAAPIDRPNLSKDYLAGNAPEDWMPLRPQDFYAQNAIDLRLGVTVAGIDAKASRVTLGDGGVLPYDRLLLATGAEPVRLSLPGAELPHVFTLRSMQDCRALLAAAEQAKRAVVMGASFIGLEVAASLRARGIEVHVVAPDKIPMERVMGPQIGRFVRSLHESHGVVFHLEDSATAIAPDRVTLKSGGTLEADLVVVGVGVRPWIALAEQAGLAIDRGVVVNEYLETSVPNILAAGDIARWPDPYSGEKIRVEHWVAAMRQGQAAARTMLGVRETFAAVPFFWSQHYDVALNYIGHAEKWDEIVIEGDIAARDGVARFMRGGRVLALVSIGRDVENLKTELMMERQSFQAQDLLNHSQR